MARIYITKIKSDIKTLVSRSQQLEVTEIEVKEKLGTAERDLSDCKLTIQQVGHRVYGGPRHVEVKIWGNP